MSYYYTKVFNQFKPKVLDFVGDKKELEKAIGFSNLLICGESHGVRENAHIIFTLCIKHNIKYLAVERSKSGFKDFVESAINGNPNFMLPRVMQSLQASMLSIEMLKTISVLQNDGIIDGVIYIDYDPNASDSKQVEDPDEYMKIREVEIAKNIIKLNKSIPTIAVLGSYHTRRYQESNDRTALEMVRDKRRATYLEYRYLDGEQYNSGRLLSFGEGENNPPSKKDKYEIMNLSTGYDDFSLSIPKAHRILV